jgi:Fe-S-cluster containining protein
MPEILCDKCAALCCRYIALPIDNPDTAKDYDYVRWYLVHENIVVFIEKKQWYIGIMTRCKHLEPDNRCGIYETRPRVCRSYSTDNCDYHGGEYDFDVLFTSAEQLRVYAEEKLNAKRRGKPQITLVPKPPRPRVRRRKSGKGRGIVSLPVLRA